MSVKRMAGDDQMRDLFSKRLQTLLDERNVSQAELSRILEVSESAVGKWLLKKAMPRMGIIQQLSDYFNVEKSYFLEDEPVGGNNTIIAAHRKNGIDDLPDEAQKELASYIEFLRSKYKK